MSSGTKNKGAVAGATDIDVNDVVLERRRSGGICPPMTEVRIAACGVSGLCFCLIFVAFVTPNWMASDRRLYGAKFERLGLWETCLRSFTKPNDLDQAKFYAGCRWIFSEDNQTLLDYLEPSFFIAVQVFFTIGFVLLLLACIFLLAIQLCCTVDKEVIAIRALALLIFTSAICCTIAVIVFGAHGDGRDWMPDPDHNYLSWSFALGVVGAFFEYVAAVLFWVESRIVHKRGDHGQQQVFSLDRH